VEYQREGFDMFTAMMDGIKEESVGYLFNLEVQVEQQVEEVPVAAAPADAVAADGVQDAVPSLVKQPEIRAKGLEAPKRADRLHFSAPSVDGEGGVVQGEFAGAAVEGGGAAESADDGLTRAERRKAAKGGRRRKK
jgi:preprotein translocase subunit SecA